MTGTTRPARLLGISGSIRRQSYCTAVLDTLRDRLNGKADLTLFPLNDIPPYDPDLDSQNTPPSTRAMREAIAGSDGLIVISPEYNYGMSGVLKNALDWASRPAMQSP